MASNCFKTDVSRFISLKVILIHNSSEWLNNDGIMLYKHKTHIDLNMCFLCV